MGEFGVDNGRFEMLLVELRRDLLSCVQLLERAGDDHWSRWLQDSVSRLDAFDRRAFEHVLGAFGGMGSFNDLILHPMNGHELAESEIDLFNDRLRELQSSICRISSDLRRDLESG